jgi:pimeloyl-ACP methyl ester carboxylesterase
VGFSVVNGARLAWQQLGQGPDLVMLHGLAASRAFWFPLAMRLSATHRVTLFDLRGHGYSERTASGYSSVAMGRDLLGLLDALEIPRASVVGHSYGGGAALDAAVAGPERIRDLALLDVRVQTLQPVMRLEDMLPLSGFEQSVLDRGGGAASVAGETQIGFRFLEEAARQRVAGLAPEGSDEFVPFGEGGGARRTAKGWLDLLDRTQARSEFVTPGADAAAIGRSITAPVLLMYGERSRCLPSRDALAKCLPRARQVTLPRAGHFFPVSAPNETFEQLQRFLSTVETSA